MKRNYQLNGLDCAHCAAKIEAAVQKLDAVHSAELNFITRTLKVNAKKDMTGDIQALVDQMEPGVTVTPMEEVAHHDETPSKLRWVQFAAAALLFGCAWLFPSFSLGFIILSYLIAGYDVLGKAVRRLLSAKAPDENFLMSLSTVGAFAIGEYHEAAAVMLLYQLGELFQSLAVRRSRRSIAQLMDIRPEFARVESTDGFEKVSPEAVSVGQTIRILPGERIPLDAVVLEGESLLDTRSLTGEAVPRKVVPGDTLISGCINTEGVLKAKVSKPASESTVTRILELVEDAAAKKAPTETFISVFARYYTPVVVALAALIGLLPPLILSQGFAPWLHRSFVFLVISCPCALVVSVPLTYFGGIGAASRHGILIKGSSYLDALTRMDTVAFDKTGTLTHGEFQVQQILSNQEAQPGEVLALAALCEQYSNHPIARSILSACPVPASGTLRDYREHPGQGVSACVDGKQLLCGSEALLEEAGISFPRCEERGTKVYVAMDGRYLGCILIADRLRSDSRQTLEALRQLDIETVMLTGDGASAAAAIAKELGIRRWHARLLPQDKVRQVEQLEGRTVAFVGDGVNDAPVLARAHIGIAMGAFGSDAAMEAADVVLLNDGLAPLVDAIGIAKATRRIVIENILLALSIKAICLILGALGLAGMWAAVFADVGVSLLAILNALRMLGK